VGNKRLGSGSSDCQEQKTLLLKVYHMPPTCANFAFGYMTRFWTVDDRESMLFLHAPVTVLNIFKTVDKTFLLPIATMMMGS